MPEDFVLHQYVDEVWADVAALVEPLTDKRVELDEVWEMIPAATDLAMKAVGLKQITGAQKKAVVVEVLRRAWRAIKDWNIPWVPDSMEWTIKGWLDPIVEAWVVRLVNQVIEKLYEANPALFGGSPA